MLAILLVFLLAQIPQQTVAPVGRATPATVKVEGCAGQVGCQSMPVQVGTSIPAANNAGTCTSVTANATILASFASRRWASIQAVVANTAAVHFKLGATATTSMPRLEPGQAWTLELPYTGQIDAIAASGTQTVCVQEL